MPDKHLDPDSWQALARDIERGCKYFWDRRGGDPYGHKWTNPYPNPCKRYARHAKAKASPSKPNHAPPVAETDLPTHQTQNRHRRPYNASDDDSWPNPWPDEDTQPDID